MHAEIWRAGTEVPWSVILVTIGLVLLVAALIVLLAGHYHVLGTDKVGQDVLYLSLKSIRTGLVIGTLTTLVTLPLALLLGIMAGYLGGRIDDVIQYLYTTLNSIPGVLLIAAAVLMTQVYMDTHPELFETVSHRADFRLLFLCIILGVTSWTGLCRLLRGEALKLRELEYIQAAQAFGVPKLRIITRHILPNVMHIVLIAIVMDFSGLVLAEAVLSYVGVGVDPSMISFGTMINSARLEMAREPMVWWSLAPRSRSCSCWCSPRTSSPTRCAMPSTRACVCAPRRSSGEGEGAGLTPTPGAGGLPIVSSVTAAAGGEPPYRPRHDGGAGARRRRSVVRYFARRDVCAARRVGLRQVDGGAFDHATCCPTRAASSAAAFASRGRSFSRCPRRRCATCAARASA